MNAPHPVIANKKPVITPPLADAKPRALCTDCGLSRTEDAKACGRACQFLNPNYPLLETLTHGRPREDGRRDETHFGVYRQMMRARLAAPKRGAQWTGITTHLAEDLLRRGKVDAVLTTMPSKKDRWKPVPVIVTDPDALSECRGMRMGFAPLLSLLGPARSAGYKRLAVIGIPCQIHALRALESELGFERLYVIGTPCSDNTTTENFWTFLNLLSDTPDDITYLEFRADYRVELRFKDGTQRFIPFLQLPISKLPQSFFPLTCQTCVDYVNALADITVGYMAGSGDQWLIVRNGRGEEMVEGLGDALVFKPLDSKGNRKSAVEGFKKNVERSAGGLPIRAMPDWLRPIISFLQPRFGPRGLEFARTRVEMKAIEAVLHLRAKAPRRIKTMVPDHIWKLVKPYGLVASETENKATNNHKR